MVRMQQTRNGVFYAPPRAGGTSKRTEPTLDADAKTLAKICLFTLGGVALLGFLASSAFTKLLLLFMGAF